MDYKIRTRVRQVVIEEKVPPDTVVTILGLVRTVRVGKGVAFIEVNDGS